MKKRLLSLALALLLMVQTFPVTALADTSGEAASLESGLTSEGPAPDVPDVPGNDEHALPASDDADGDGENEAPAPHIPGNTDGDDKSETPVPGVSGDLGEDETDPETGALPDAGPDALLLGAALALDDAVWDGTAETEKEPAMVGDVYQIGTAAELAWFRTYVNNTAACAASAVLTADIDLGEHTWEPISNRSYATEQYRGTFDGQFFTIKGLVTQSATYQGLFGRINGATIKNLNVDGNIDCRTSNYIGGIVGQAQASRIENCSFSGSIKGGYTGGIVGSLNSTGGTIQGCVNLAAVNGTYAGGILGYTTGKNTIESCYNAGTITASSRAGGIVGQAVGTIANCYNKGTIAGSSNIGGIYGFGSASLTITNCYHLLPESEILGTSSAAKSTKISGPEGLLDDLDSDAFVDGGDANGGYPLLSWQSAEEPDLTPSIRLSGDTTIYVKKETGKPDETLLSVSLKNIDPEDMNEDNIVWDVETAKGTAAPGEIVGLRSVEGTLTQKIISAKQGGTVTVTVTVTLDGYDQPLTKSLTISVVPQITTAEIKNVSPLGAVAEGQTVRVQVNTPTGEYDYANFPSLTYQWKRRVVLTDTTAVLSGKTEQTYDVPFTAGYVDQKDQLLVDVYLDGKVVASGYAGLRIQDYGILYPAANDPEIAPPSEIKSDGNLTLLPSHTVDGVTVNITWSSSNGAIISPTGVVTRPQSGIQTVTLTARCAYGEAGAYANKTFSIKVYSDEAVREEEAQKSYLKDAAAALGGGYGAFAPVYGKDENLTDMLKTKLTERGFGDLSIAVKSVTQRYGGAGIAPNGGLTYFYADPNGTQGLWFGQYEVAVTLERDGDRLDVPGLVVNLYWDQNRVEDTLRSEILSGVTEEIILGENTDADSVTKSLVLPKVVDGKKWAQIQWTSSDPSAILVSSENQGTADTLFNPYVGKILRGGTDREVTLSAKIVFQRTGFFEPEIVLDKTFTVTVPALSGGEAEAVRVQLLQTLDRGFNAVGLRDYVTGQPLAQADGKYLAANDIQLPTTRDFKVDGKYLPITITGSDEDTLAVPGVANAARVTVYRPPVGAAAKDVTLTVSITDLAKGVSASRDFVLSVQPLTQGEIDGALALMDLAKTEYFAGLSDGRYADEYSVTGGLHSFQEAVWNGTKDGLRWIYRYDQTTRGGIIADELDNWAEQEAWRAFRSSDADILAHESLNLAARPAQDTFVRVNSMLTHAVYGKYAGRDGYPGMEALYKQPVSVYVLVAGIHHVNRTPEELAQMKQDAIARIDAPISAGFTLFGTKPQTQMRAMAASSMDDVVIDTTVTGLEAGTTVFGLFRRVMAEQGYTYKAVGSYVKSVTDADGNTLSERDGGRNSGWIYTVNGKLPAIYMNGYALKEGDEVVVRFTNDYTKEEGFDVSSGHSSSSRLSTFFFSAPDTGVVGNAMDTSPATAQQAAGAIADLAANGGARFVNVTGISPATAKLIAAGTGLGTQIFADTVIGGAITGRLYLDPVAAGKLTGPIDTRIDTSAQGTAAVSGTFRKFFSNTMVFAQLGQTGPFGMQVGIALRLDLTGLNPGTLTAYVYDAASNTYTRLSKPWVDKNGFVHVNMVKGGALVFTDQPLTLK